MERAIKNFRDRVAETYVAGKKSMKEGLQKRLGDPPSSAAGRPQKDDAYRAYWKLGKGWEDPSQHAAQAASMYAAGAKPSDVLKAMYPMRVELIPYGERKSDIEAQVKFCNEMVAQHMEELASAAVSLRDQMNDEGSLSRG